MEFSVRQHHYLILACTLLLTLMVAPLITVFGVSGRFVEFLLLLNLAAAAFGAERRGDRTRILLVVLGAGALRAALHWYPVRALFALTAALWIGLAIAAMVRALRFALRGRRIDSEHILAAFSVYLLAGHFYGFAYWQIESTWPGSFYLYGAPTALGQFDLSSATYLSFVTIATLGFGDITPHSEVARGFVITEAVLGQFYLAVLVARLVAGYASRDTVRRGSSPTPGACPPTPPDGPGPA